MKDIVGSILVLAGCIFYFNMNMAYPAQAQTFPRAVIIITGVLSAIWLGISVKKYLNLKASAPVEEKNKTLSPKDKTIILVLLELLLYVVVVDKIGYYSSTFLYLLITMYTLGYKNKLVMLVLPIVIVSLIGMVFGKILLIPLPEGLLF